MSTKSKDGSQTEAIEKSGAHANVQQFRLRILAGDEAGLVFTSRSSRTVLGTDKSADVIFSDRTMSRFHCEITVDDSGVRICDLKSRNGTLVDGVAIEAAKLHDGATMTLGRTKIRIELGADTVKVPLSEKTRFGQLVGQSRRMRAVFALLERAAESDITLLLGGETGTGKDLAAESVHNASARKDGPFVIFDCSAVAPTLIASELFGHERGAFTGADRAREGAFERADGGTLFLDELGELPPELQPPLLRVLESRKVQRVGGNTPIPVNVRVICATNRNLRSEVNAGNFRSDLYFRLAVLEVALPPLRDRVEDIPLLVDTILGHLPVDKKQASAKINEDLIRRLQQHAWPGNVRELRNQLERYILLDAEFEAIGDGNAVIDVREPIAVARDKWLRVFERRYLEDILAKYESNVTKAAEAAGVARRHFYRLLAINGLEARDGSSRD